MLTATFPDDAQFEADRDRAFRAFAARVQRVEAAGRQRPDFVAEDLVMMLMANAGVISASEAAPQISLRLVAYLLQACRAEGAQPLPSVPSPRSIYQALRRLLRSRET